MREISTEKIKIGEHVIIDGVEYVSEEGSCGGCELDSIEDCDLDFLCPANGKLTRIKKEPVYRPYKDTDEMMADYKERFNVSKVPDFCMPLIWVKNMSICSLITGIMPDEHVIVYGEFKSMRDLFEIYTYLDGSPCGKVEE